MSNVSQHEDNEGHFYFQLTHTNRQQIISNSRTIYFRCYDVYRYLAADIITLPLPYHRKG